MKYEDVYLTSKQGIKIHGWYIQHPDHAIKKRKTLLFFHGNAGNISHRKESIEIFYQLGLNVLIIDYRGYGQSQGEPTEQGLYDDAKLAWHYLTESGVSPKTIVIFGRSLGGAVAAKLATEVTPDSLILESTFTSVRAMSRDMLPIINWFVYIRYKFNTLDIIKKVNCPVLVIHSPADELIKYKHGIELFKQARQPKAFIKLSGSHNQGFIQSQPGYQKLLRHFIKR